MIVTHADMRALNYCNSGARDWFKSHKLDWSTFISEGLPEETLLATDDQLALDVVEQAHKRVVDG